MLSQRFSVPPVSGQVSPLLQRELSLEAPNLMFSFSMNAFIAFLICLQLKKLGVHIILVFLTLIAPTRAIKESRSGPIPCRSLVMISGLSLRQAMCVSVSKSTPPLDFPGKKEQILQEQRQWHCSVQWSHHCQTMKRDHFLYCCWSSPAPTTYPITGQVLSRFSHQFVSPDGPSLSPLSYPCMR